MATIRIVDYIMINPKSEIKRVVVYDFGVKLRILRNLVLGQMMQGIYLRGSGS